MQLLVFILLAALINLGVCQECGNWTYFEEKCYGYADTAVEWTEAQIICHVEGTTLAEARNPRENDFLTTMARNQGVSREHRGFPWVILRSNISRVYLFLNLKTTAGSRKKTAARPLVTWAPVDLKSVTCLWLGGSDIFQEGVWKWPSGSNFSSFTSWAKGEPNNDKNEDCLNMFKSKNYKWNDDSCKRICNFICVYPVE